MTHDTAVQVKGYMMVFGTLLVLTMATVAVSYVHLPTGPSVALGLLIATVKASLVALFFMHLKHERAVIYMSLGLTVVLFAALLGFTLWSEFDHGPGTEFTQPYEEGIR